MKYCGVNQKEIFEVGVITIDKGEFLSKSTYNCII